MMCVYYYYYSRPITDQYIPVYVYIYTYVYNHISTKWLGFNFTPDPTMVQGIVVLFVGDIYYMTLLYAMLGCSALHYIAILMCIYIYINIIYTTLHYHYVYIYIHGESQILINKYIFSHGEWTHFTIVSKRLSRTNVRI